MVKTLKEEIKHVNAFVILFNGEVCNTYYVLATTVKYMFTFFIGQAARFTRELKNMIIRFEDIFGGNFWPNVIFAVSR